MDYGSEEFKAGCMAAYEALQGEGRSNVFLPLKVDPASGAGLYILGVNNIDETSLGDGEDLWQRLGKKDWKKFTCHFCSIRWAGIENQPGIL